MSIGDGNSLVIAIALATAVVVLAELLSFAWLVVFGPGREGSGHFAYTARFLSFVWIVACGAFGAAVAFIPQLLDAIGITQVAFAFYLACAVVAGAVIGAAINVHIARRGDLREPPSPFE